MDSLWSRAALGDEYWVENLAMVEPIQEAIRKGRIRTHGELVMAATAQQNRERLPKPKPKPAAPVTTTDQEDTEGQETSNARPYCKKCRRYHRGQCWKCTKCGRFGHLVDRCRKKEGGEATGPVAAESGTKEQETKDQRSNEAGSQYTEGPQILVVRCALQGLAMEVGADTMAALNIIRGDALPPGVEVTKGGPELHGVGLAQSEGVVRVNVTLGGLEVGAQEFVVVQSLPVMAILGKPLLAAMGARIDVAAGTVRINVGGKTTKLRAVAVPAVPSERPRAQAYWQWLNVRLSKAEKRLQTHFQDVMERADDAMLLEFLKTFPAFALRQRQESKEDDPNVHPAPLRPELRRPATTSAGAVTCPALVDATTILGQPAPEWPGPAASDHKSFLPAIMTPVEEEEIIIKEFDRMVAKSTFSEGGKKRRVWLMRHMLTAQWRSRIGGS